MDGKYIPALIQSMRETPRQRTTELEAARSCIIDLEYCSIHQGFIVVAVQPIAQLNSRGL